jgi:hypothetical protein
LKGEENRNKRTKKRLIKRKKTVKISESIFSKDIGTFILNITSMLDLVDNISSRSTNIGKQIKYRV